MPVQTKFWDAAPHRGTNRRTSSFVSYRLCIHPEIEAREPAQQPQHSPSRGCLVHCTAMIAVLPLLLRPRLQACLDRGDLCAGHLECRIKSQNSQAGLTAVGQVPELTGGQSSWWATSAGPPAERHHRAASRVSKAPAEVRAVQCRHMHSKLCAAGSLWGARTKVSSGSWSRHAALRVTGAAAAAAGGLDASLLSTSALLCSCSVLTLTHACCRAATSARCKPLTSQCSHDAPGAHDQWRKPDTILQELFTLQVGFVPLAARIISTCWPLNTDIHACCDRHGSLSGATPDRLDFCGLPHSLTPRAARRQVASQFALLAP